MQKRSNECEIERLELRQMLSAVPQNVVDAGFGPMQWHGHELYAKPGQWIVQLSGLSGQPGKQLEAANRELGALNAAFAATRHLGRDGLVLLNAPKEIAAEKLTAALSKLSNFDYLEPDGALWTDATTSNDPSASQLWGLNNTGQTGGTPDADIDAPEAWDITRGNGSVVVGVIDTGIDYKHPDLQSNMWVNTAELNGKRNFDDDGDGYKDDIYGYDFANNDSDPLDDNGHGTHVAGTIAAAGNNGIGVVGVNWNAKVMALKFLGSNGSGTWSAAVEATNYATNMSARGVNIKLTSNSYSGWEYSNALYDAIKRNGDAGMLFVAAAGNEGGKIDSGGAYPAAFDLPNIISVAATDHNDALASFSNYGTVNVDLAAPGVNILSTLRNNTYGTKSGTSMAAPHVSGVAALAWSYAPTASYKQMRNALLVGADQVASLSGKVFSGGRLNAFGTLAHVNDPYTDPTAPTAPTDLTASPWLYDEPGQTPVSVVDLSWQHPGAPELQRFDVYRSTAGGAFVRVGTTAANQTTFRDTYLDPDTTYTYRVTAGNFVVSSDPSATIDVHSLGTKVVLPNAPTSLRAIAVSSTQINLTWTDNSDNETSFMVERSTDGSQWSQLVSLNFNTTSFSNTGLKRNATYYYRVRAYNSAGYSAYSNVASARTSLATISSAPLFSSNTIGGDSDPSLAQSVLV